MRTEILQELLERANAEPLGLAVRTNMTHAMNGHISEARTRLGFHHLMVARPSQEGWLFIIHKSVELET